MRTLLLATKKALVQACLLCRSSTTFNFDFNCSQFVILLTIHFIFILSPCLAVLAYLVCLLSGHP